MNNDERSMRNGTRDARKCCLLNPGEFFTPLPFLPLSLCLFNTADDVKAKRACTCMSCLVIVVTVTVFMLFCCSFFFRFVSGFERAPKMGVRNCQKRRQRSRLGYRCLWRIVIISVIQQQKQQQHENIYKPQGEESEH